jgi:hypothetical protein
MARISSTNTLNSFSAFSPGICGITSDGDVESNSRLQSIRRDLRRSTDGVVAAYTEDVPARWLVAKTNARNGSPIQSV